MYLHTKQFVRDGLGPASLRHVALDGLLALRRPHSRLLVDAGGVRHAQLAQVLAGHELAQLHGQGAAALAVQHDTRQLVVTWASRSTCPACRSSCAG